MLLSCFYHYKLKDFHFKSPKFLKQGRLCGGKTGVHIWVLRESTAPSTTTAPGSCCIPTGLRAAVHLKSNSRSKRRVLDIVPSQCKYCKVLWPVFKCISVDVESHQLTFCITSVSEVSIAILNQWSGSQTLNLSPAISWITNQSTFTAHNMIQLVCHLLPGPPKSRCSGKFCPHSTKVPRHSWRRATFLTIFPKLDYPALQCLPAAKAILLGPRTAKASAQCFFFFSWTDQGKITPKTTTKISISHTVFQCHPQTFFYIKGGIC